MPKGYWIAFVDVTEPEAYAKYRTLNGAAFAKFGGRFLVRNGTHVVANGAAKPRPVVIEFPDYAAALACHESEEYKRAVVFRNAGASVDLVIVEGYEGEQPR
jgi:uncharacterized protein (DUF1330 family)